jgi:hypothetical protein
MTKRKRKIGGQYVPHLRELIEAPAWRVLSLSARRVLDRIEIEYLRHGGQENGKLPVTYENFREYGMDRDAIAPAIRECIALGLLVITRPGSAGNADQRAPNLFLLPYLEANTAGQLWRQITTVEEANNIARTAARRPGKNKIPIGVSRSFQSGKPRPKTAFSIGQTPTGGPEIPSRGNPDYFLDASHGGAVDGNTGSDAKAPPRSGDPVEEVIEIPEVLGWRQRNGGRR